MSDEQLPLEGLGAATAAELPEGFVYETSFLSDAEEAALAQRFLQWDFDEVRMRGVTAKRTVRHFGFTYDFDTGRLIEREPWPHDLLWLQDRCAELAGVKSSDLAEALVTRYPEGATIGWHRDAPQFGPKVVGVSLLTPCRMRFRRGKVRNWETAELTLAPRSAYVIGGPARFQWQHHIPAIGDLRYSVTFRTLRDNLGAARF